MNENNIAILTNNSLCCGCGICTAICPTKAVTLRRNTAGFILSSVDEEKCFHCGKCLKVCPKYEDYKIRYKKQDEKDPDELIKKTYAKAIKGYICQASDNDIRENGQSGGVITAVLKYMLESSLIEEAYINKFDPEINANKMIKATTLSEICEGAGSFYSQASAEKCIGNDKSVAVVLGCQANAIRRFQQIGSSTPMYLIGLFCGGNFSGKYYERLEGKYREKRITSFRFRNKKYGGWPGNISFEADGKSIIIDKKIRMKEKETYLCASCDYCNERINTNSDLAVGDPWGISDMRCKEGCSVVLTYTEKGDELIQAAFQQGYLIGNEIPVKDIISGQDVNYQFFSNYNKRITNKCGKIELIRIRLRNRLYNSKSMVTYRINLLAFHAYEKTLRVMKRIRRR